MIEERPLTKEELTLLLAEAPLAEVKNLNSYLDKHKLDAYEFINMDAVYKFGLIAGGRPIYFAYIKKNEDKYELWTVVNSDVKEQFSLYKYSKNSLQFALRFYSPIYATMEKHSKANIAWVEKLGFKRVFEDDHIITFRIDKQES